MVHWKFKTKIMRIVGLSFLKLAGPNGARSIGVLDPGYLFVIDKGNPPPKPPPAARAALAENRATIAPAAGAISSCGLRLAPSGVGRGPLADSGTALLVLEDAADEPTRR